MTYKELYDLLITTTLPVTYNRVDEKSEPPYIVYIGNGIDTFTADDKVYHKENKFNVILVTDKKDLTQESTLETLFDNNHICYNKYESYDTKERIYQISYTI